MAAAKAVRRAAALACACAAAALLGACGDAEPLRIGFIGGLSGRGADLPESARNGVMLRVEQQQAAGDLDGRAVELVVRDHGKDPAAGTRAMQELLEQGAVAVIGPMTSGMTVALQPLAESAGVVMVTPTATSMTLVDRDDLLFRMNGSTRDFAGAYADFHYRRTGLRRVALAYDAGNASFTESWLTEFKRAFEALGGAVVAAVPFVSSAETALDGVLAAMLEADPDGLVFVANAVDTAQLCQQARKLAPTLPKSAAEWSASETLLELGGGAVEGLVIVQSHDRDDRSPGFLAFRAAYRERFEAEPSFASVIAYDAATVVLAALARDPAPERLKQTLLELPPQAGLQQPLAFNRYGDGQRTPYFTVIRDNRFVRLY